MFILPGQKPSFDIMPLTTHIQTNNLFFIYFIHVGFDEKKKAFLSSNQAVNQATATQCQPKRARGGF